MTLPKAEEEEQSSSCSTDSTEDGPAPPKTSSLAHGTKIKPHNVENRVNVEGKSKPKSSIRGMQKSTDYDTDTMVEKLEVVSLQKKAAMRGSKSSSANTPSAGRLIGKINTSTTDEKPKTLPLSVSPPTNTAGLPLLANPPTNTARAPLARSPPTKTARLPSSMSLGMNPFSFPPSVTPSTNTARPPIARSPPTKTARLPLLANPPTNTARVPLARSPPTKTARRPPSVNPSTNTARALLASPIKTAKASPKKDTPNARLPSNIAKKPSIRSKSSSIISGDAETCVEKRFAKNKKDRKHHHQPRKSSAAGANTANTSSNVAERGFLADVRKHQKATILPPEGKAQHRELLAARAAKIKGGVCSAKEVCEPKTAYARSKYLDGTVRDGLGVLDEADQADDATVDADTLKKRVIARAKAMILALEEKWSPEECQNLFYEEDLIELCYRVYAICFKEPSLLDISGPVNICGDIHGQFTDLRAIFREIGYPPKQKYLFLGDYVDRGCYSLEVLVLLFSLKILYPTQVCLLRGNHESSDVNVEYGFFREILFRYSLPLYDAIQTVFGVLPFAALVEGRVLCMHGGISQSLKSLAQIRKIKRPCRIPDVGIVCDLTWADPERHICGFKKSPRGAAHVFGPDTVDKFCADLGVDLIVRAHQVPKHGYDVFDGEKLITIFSAMRYCNMMDNDSSVFHVKRVDSHLNCSLTVFSSRQKGSALSSSAETESSSTSSNNENGDLKPCT